MPAGLFVSELSPVGPASRAGFRQGDRILKVNGVAVASQEEFYEQLWSRRAGDLIELSVQRDNQVRTISVPSVDRHRPFQVQYPHDLAGPGRKRPDGAGGVDPLR